jgi:hypothetical protein
MCRWESVLQDTGGHVGLRKAVVLGSVTLAIVLLATALFAGGARVAHANSEAAELADLEQRMDNLPYPRYTPLFEVVDQQDKPIFTVTSYNSQSVAYVSNSKLNSVVSMNADANGGSFLVQTGDGQTGAFLGIDRTWAGLRVSERVIEDVPQKDGTTRGAVSNVPAIELGGYAGGNYSLKFLTSARQLLAGIGESKAGSGALIIGDSQGRKRASMFVGEDSKGIIGIYNQSGNALVAMGEATGNTGGSLVIGDAKGEPRVKMGTNENHYGVVIAFPQGLAYVPKSGLPGSYMLGCAGGSGCEP